MMLLRGNGQTLEIGCAERDLAGVCSDLRERLSERPEFYRGSRATAIFGEAVPASNDLELLRDVLAEFEIALDGVRGADALAGLALELGLAYLGPPPVREFVPRPRAARDVQLSDPARSLVADFAGARADLAARRLGRKAPASRPVAAMPESRPVAPGPSASAATLYHRGTLRGGQAVHHLGNIVVLGDVNPGAELVASGDIVVFGSLRGVAHAGAQGDEAARVVALELAPTQLRIAAVIAADAEPTGGRGAEHALIRDGRIVIVPHDGAEIHHQEAGH